METKFYPPTIYLSSMKEKKVKNSLLFLLLCVSFISLPESLKKFFIYSLTLLGISFVKTTSTRILFLAYFIFSLINFRIQLEEYINKIAVIILSLLSAKLNLYNLILPLAIGITAIIGSVMGSKNYDNIVHPLLGFVILLAAIRQRISITTKALLILQIATGVLLVGTKTTSIHYIHALTASALISWNIYENDQTV